MTCQEGNVQVAKTHSSIQVSRVFVVCIVGERWREPVTPEGA